MDKAEINERKRAKTRAALADWAERLYAGAKKRAAVAGLLRALHSQLRLWRLCANEGCRRARACRGDQLRCGARRALVILSCLQKAADTGASGGGAAARRAVADQHVKDWIDEDGVPVRAAQKIIICWMSSAGSVNRTGSDG